MKYPETEQEIFDLVWQHFIVEKHPRSFVDVSQVRCAYRGVDGARCAVGLFIPDELYDKSMDFNDDDSGVEPLLDAGYFDKDDDLREFIRDHVDFLSVLQRAHDSAQYPLEGNLRDVATVHKLEVPRADR